jgi:hypothetical protein
MKTETPATFAPVTWLGVWFLEPITTLAQPLYQLHDLVGCNLNHLRLAAKLVLANLNSLINNLNS